MEASSIATPAPGAASAPGDSNAEKPQLKHNALGYISNVVIGVASTAPGYSLAATIGFIAVISGMGTHTPAVIIVSFIPMLFIALAYRNLNAVDPDCGTTFSWMTRAMGAGWGFLGGWMLIFSDIVVNANQAQIAGSYGVQLFGGTATTTETVLIGGAFIVILTFICWKGIEISARTQWLLLFFELTTLVVFAVVALIKVYANHPAHSMGVQLDWFNPFHVGITPLLDGMLLGVFLFWGWDTGVSVNEESQNTRTGPGRSAIASTVVLIAVFLLVSVASQAYAGNKYLANNPNDIFAGGLSKAVLGSLHVLLIIAVLSSATAATQTTILPAARAALSMGRRGALPARFAVIHKRNLVPAFATLWAGILSLLWFVFIEYVSTNVLGDCVAGLGFLVCFYYGFTGVASAVFFRGELGKSVRNAFMLGILPLIGAAVLGVIFVKGMIFYGHAGNDYSKPFLGLGVPDWIGILGIGSGVVLMIVGRLRSPRFYRERRYKAGERFETVTPEAEFAPADSML
jgi:amino acid transporter